MSPRAMRSQRLGEGVGDNVHELPFWSVVLLTWDRAPGTDSCQVPPGRTKAPHRGACAIRRGGLGWGQRRMISAIRDLASFSVSE